VIDFHNRGKRIPPKTFVVTFDDGYENVYRYAWPVLKELVVPATIFLATAYLDSELPFPFDDWTAAGSMRVPGESWKPLTTEQCHEMQREGLVTLGTHTHTHGIFRGRPEALHRDLLVSLDVLRTRFGVTDCPFAFPYGITDPDLTDAARATGVSCSLTTQSGLVAPNTDPFTWGRWTVESSDTASTLAAKLAGWYSVARTAWQKLCLFRDGVRDRCPSRPRTALHNALETVLEPCQQLKSS
jgi:peptidoglycan/xylan/chitin deacetylase (PgdA/CDA1 family)